MPIYGQEIIDKSIRDQQHWLALVELPYESAKRHTQVFAYTAYGWQVIQWDRKKRKWFDAGTTRWMPQWAIYVCYHLPALSDEYLKAGKKRGRKKRRASSTGRAVAS